jgi:hypothetical protein
MAERKDRFALISKFEQYCRNNNVRLQTINKYNEQWAADALLESFTFDQLNQAMKYYFSINQRPTWKGFANNADRLLQSMNSKIQDDEFRAEMRNKAKEWLSESRG